MYRSSGNCALSPIQLSLHHTEHGTKLCSPPIPRIPSSQCDLSIGSSRSSSTSSSTVCNGDNEWLACSFKTARQADRRKVNSTRLVAILTLGIIASLPSFLRATTCDMYKEADLQKILLNWDKIFSSSLTKATITQKSKLIATNLINDHIF